jgi:hypothetical protein
MRIRTIKPEFFTHEGLFELEHETKLPIRLGFVGLWCAADREGRFKWEPRRLGVLILPYDSVDFSRVMDACLTRGLLVKYRVDDAWFGAIPSWHKHQVVNPRERASEIPAIDDAQETSDACPTRAPRVNHACRKEGKGREGNMEGKEKDALQLKVEALMKRRTSTPMSPKEAQAYKAAMPSILAMTEDDWQAMERFYAAPQGETYARKDLATLLNNWNGEIDRAKAWQPKANGHAVHLPRELTKRGLA